MTDRRTFENQPKASTQGYGVMKVGSGLTVVDGVVHAPAGAAAGNSVVSETAFSESPDPGSSNDFSRSDHTHGTPDDPIPDHVAELDPHPQYEETGTAAAAIAAHVIAADPHTQYQKESEKNAAGGYAGLNGSSKLDGTQQTYGDVANTAVEGNDPRLARTLFTAVVAPSGGDYTTVKAAIDAGKSRLLITGNVTETANIDIVAASMPNVYIYIVAGANLDMGPYRFTDTGTVASVTVEGMGKITYAHTVASEELFDLAAGTIYMDGPTVDNNSTQSGCRLSAGSIEKISRVRFELPNASSGGLIGFQLGSVYSDIVLVGGGTSCEYGMSVDSAEVRNILFTGTFIPAATSYAAYIGSSNVKGLIFEHSTNAIALDLSDSNVSSVHGQSGQSVTLGFATEMSDIVDVGGGMIIEFGYSITNVLNNGGTMNITGFDNISNALFITSIDNSSLDNCSLSNITTSALVLSHASSNECKYSNVRVTGAVTIAGDLNKFTNCDFLGGASVSSGADNNGFMNCQFGPDSGGGVLTLTVVAGANNTRIVGCMTDAAIVDGGTNTVILAPVIY